MKTPLFGFLLSFALTAGMGLSAQTSLPEVQIQQLLLAQPPQAVVHVSHKLAVNGVDDPIIVSFVNADLDGSGSFQFFVALYTTEQTNGGFLRVFRQGNDALVVAGDQDTSRPVGGYSAALNLIDVNGDGVPEIEVDSTSADGQSHSFSLFLWTGSGLHDMVGSSVENGSFTDLDRDGVLEILISQPGSGGVDVFKLVDRDYQFLKSFSGDPTGLTGPDGNIVMIRAFCKDIEPGDFSVTQVKHAREDRGHDRDDAVLLRFGRLEQVNGPQVDVDQVDLASILLNPHLTPQRAVVHRVGNKREDEREKDGSQGCRDDISTVDVRISRRDFLRSLQRLQPQAPLQAGNKIEIPLSGRLRDGRPLSAIFSVRIVARDENDDAHEKR
jgi:hypothetical protein